MPPPAGMPVDDQAQLAGAKEVECEAQLAGAKAVECKAQLAGAKAVECGEVLGGVAAGGSGEALARLVRYVDALEAAAESYVTLGQVRGGCGVDPVGAGGDVVQAALDDDLLLVDERTR